MHPVKGSTATSPASILKDGERAATVRLRAPPVHDAVDCGYFGAIMLGSARPGGPT